MDNVAHAPETVFLNSGSPQISTYFSPICSYPSFATHHRKALLWNQPELEEGSSCSLPSWIPPNTWSLGRTRLCTVFNSSTQPTLCSSFGTQSRKPEGKTQSIRLIFAIQVRFHVVFQEVINHGRFITLSLVVTSPLKHTTAFKKCFTVTLSSLKFPSSSTLIFFWMWFGFLNYGFKLIFHLETLGHLFPALLPIFLPFPLALRAASFPQSLQKQNISGTPAYLWLDTSVSPKI